MRRPQIDAVVPYSPGSLRAPLRYRKNHSTTISRPALNTPPPQPRPHSPAPSGSGKKARPGDRSPPAQVQAQRIGAITSHRRMAATSTWTVTVTGTVVFMGQPFWSTAPQSLCSPNPAPAPNLAGRPPPPRKPSRNASLFEHIGARDQPESTEAG